MQQKNIIIILLLLLSLTLTKRYNLNKQKIIQSSQKIYQYTQNQYLFEQIVDHFNYQSSTTWKQRYWAIDNYFNPKVGPVFLYICGEYTCPGVPSSRQWVVTLAQRTQGLILVLQHRFYGESLPFGNQSFNLQNLKLLNSQQALKDLAYFLDQVNTTNLFQVNNNPWITIGGSYPGALSAWFRYKYPHLTIGGIASSAVVQAIEDFPEFDEQIYTSSFLSGQFCVDALNKSSILVQNVLNSTQAMIFKSQFKDADKLSDDQFLFFWVDSIVGAIQYGQRTQLCDSLKNKSEGQQFETIISLVQKNQVYQYGSYFLKNQTFAYISGQGSRSWYYQSCSQFGFWQTMNLHHPMRSSRLTIDFYRKFCSDSFQTGLWPKVQRKNIEYGGLKQQSTNLLMVNGVEDPWRWASIQQSQGKIISRVANCSNCAHCVDLYTPSTNDSPELKQIRSQQYLTILNWIEQFWKKPIFHIRTQLEEE